MTQGSNLKERRGELKRQLAAGEYKSSIDVILDSVGRILQRLTRRSSPPASWISALAIALLVSLMAWLSSFLTGGMSGNGYGVIASGGALIFSNLLIAQAVFGRTFATLQDKLLDGLESSAGLSGLHDWLSAVSDAKRPTLTGLLIYVAYVVAVLPDPMETPAEIIVVGVIMLLWTGFMIYYMFQFVILPLRLSRCHFRLHAEDPASTEVLADWTGMMNLAGYSFATMLAAGTLFTVGVGTFRLRTLVFVIARWLPLIALLVVNQLAVSAVITQSKRESLNNVQAQMATLRPKADPPDKDAIETLLGLWDYHDRIKGTRDTMLDIKGIRNLVNTLLIPLLAFVLKNRAALFDLLGWSM